MINLGNIAATAKLTVYNPQGIVTIRLWKQTNAYAQIIIPQSDTPSEVSLYCDECYFLQLFSRVKQTFYVDNLSLVK